MLVSMDGGVLDLFSPKFGLDGLGMPGEKVMIRVVVASKDRSLRIAVFGNYTIGGRHAQIATREIQRLGKDVEVVSVARYALKDFIEDVNKGLEVHEPRHAFRLAWEKGRTLLNLNGRSVSVMFREMFTTAGKAYGIFDCGGKSKVMAGEGVELFDLQGRRVSGLTLKGDKLIPERSFQNPVEALAR